MKVRIGKTNEEIEINQFREVNKGVLKGFFSLIEYPTGRVTLDCRYFVQGEKRWFSFPQKEIHFNDGRKPEYIPLVSYRNKAYLEQFKAAILTALRNWNTQEKNEKQKNISIEDNQNKVSTDPQADWEDAPF